MSAELVYRVRPEGAEELRKMGVTVGAAVTDPWGGSRATSMTGSSGAAYMQIDIEPTAINGRVLCASAWLRSAAGARRLASASSTEQRLHRARAAGG